MSNKQNRFNRSPSDDDRPCRPDYRPGCVCSHAYSEWVSDILWPMGAQLWNYVLPHVDAQKHITRDGFWSCGRAVALWDHAHLCARMTGVDVGMYLRDPEQQLALAQRKAVPRIPIDAVPRSRGAEAGYSPAAFEAAGL